MRRCEETPYAVLLQTATTVAWRVLRNLWLSIPQKAGVGGAFLGMASFLWNPTYTTMSTPIKTPTPLIGLLAMLLLAGWAFFPVQFSVHPESQLSIDGTSSLHDWTCEVGTVQGTLVSTTEDATAIEQVELVIPIDAIGCKNDTMDRKMRDALKADDHPMITYTFARHDPATTSADGTFSLATTGTLRIAGAEKTVQVTVNGEQLPDGAVRFRGTVPLIMTEFGVTPPKALMGTLKTGDAVTIRFDVKMAR